MRELAAEQLTLTDDLRTEMLRADDCDSLYAPLEQDFWVELTPEQASIRLAIDVRLMSMQFTMSSNVQQPGRI